MCTHFGEAKITGRLKIGFGEEESPFNFGPGPHIRGGIMVTPTGVGTHIGGVEKILGRPKIRGVKGR